jgi:hypothetical protein
MNSIDELQKEYLKTENGTQRKRLESALYSELKIIAIKQIKVILKKAKTHLSTYEIDNKACETAGYVLMKMCKGEVVTNPIAYSYLAAKKFLYSRTKKDMFNDGMTSYENIASIYTREDDEVM